MFHSLRVPSKVPPAAGAHERDGVSWIFVCRPHDCPEHGCDWAGYVQFRLDCGSSSSSQGLELHLRVALGLKASRNLCSMILGQAQAWPLAHKTCARHQVNLLQNSCEVPGFQLDVDS